MPLFAGNKTALTNSLCVEKTSARRRRWTFGLLILLCLLLPQEVKNTPHRIPVGWQWQTMLAQREQLIRFLAGRWTPYVVLAARKTGLSPLLLAAVLHTESRGCGKAVSAAGAIGPMQLLPTTATEVLHINPWKPRQNILGAAGYLRQLLETFGGQLTLALEAYNAGPTRIALHTPVPTAAVQYAKNVEKWLQMPAAPRRGRYGQDYTKKSTTQL